MPANAKHGEQGFCTSGQGRARGRLATKGMGAPRADPEDAPEHAGGVSARQDCGNGDQAYRNGPIFRPQTQSEARAGTKGRATRRSITTETPTTERRSTSVQPQNVALTLSSNVCARSPRLHWLHHVCRGKPARRLVPGIDLPHFTRTDPPTKADRGARSSTHATTGRCRDFG